MKKHPALPRSSYPSPFDFGDSEARGWRSVILRVGHKPTVAAITGVSILMSMVLTALVTVALNNTANMAVDLLIAFIVPLVIAPLASYYAVGLLFEVEHARAQLQIAAIRDSLTGLFNRGYFLARLREHIQRTREEGRPLSLVLMDVDRFKGINDSFGHAAGDAVLEHLGQVLTEALQPYGLIARYGGEEFVALLPGANLAEANAAAERFRAMLAGTTFDCLGDNGRCGSVTASVGVTCLGHSEDTADALLARADRAMYAAKNAGRNHCVTLAP